MDFNIGIGDVRMVICQELWNKLGFQATQLVAETRDVLIEKQSFHEFSSTISELNILLRSLSVNSLEASLGWEPTKCALETLESQLRKASNIIRDYRSKSRLSLLLQSHKLLSAMQDLAKEIAHTVSSFKLANLDMAISLKSKTDQIINNLRSMEFRSVVATENISSDIENLMSHNCRDQENAVLLLEKIAAAVGVSANASLVQNELQLLKQEKEEMEAQKKQAEALQLSQLIQLLNSTEIVASPQDEDVVSSYHEQYPIESIICQLCNEMMTDPVAIICGHSFERKAIQEYFERGAITCPTCRQELPSQELTPNISLRDSIEKWKQRDMDFRFQTATSGITSGDHSRQNKALEEMQVLMERPCYAAEVVAKGLVPKMVEFLKDNRLNTIAALKCLCCLAKNCDKHKEAIVEAGGIRCLVKQIYRGEAESYAITVLLELSETETLGDKIGNNKDCIPVLVSLLSNNNQDVSQKAHMVLQNLSSNIHFAVKMAEVGHFKPFVARFNQGHQETRASMAAALIKIQLKENSIKDLKDEQFIHNLVHMLPASSPACKSASLHSIKKLIAYPEMVKQFLVEPATIPHLLGLISLGRSDSHWKQEAAEILVLLIGPSQISELDMYPGLQELQSQHNVYIFLKLVASSDPQTKVKLLHLLVVLSHKSETVQNLVRTDKDAVAHLFSTLDGDQPLVRQWGMRLINCISEGRSAGVPLPSSPLKESAINTLAAILTHSTDIEERSAAAGIIGQLPMDDNVIDEILSKSEVLKAIHEVLCSTDEEYKAFRPPANLAASLLENALGALLRFTEPTKPELQRLVSKLEMHPLLVPVLSKGSSLAKQRTAIALAHLSQSTNLSISDSTNVATQANNSMPALHRLKPFLNMTWCCPTSSEHQSPCSVHGTACLSKHTFCLVKADAITPLVQTLSETESGAAEAALMALETLLIDRRTLPHAASTIVDNQGVVAILRLLEKGSFSARSKALDLFVEILRYTQITGTLFHKSERILVQLLQDDALKKKVALVLRQMNVIPEQSSYF
ncbi:U-box domain-containing protein 44-like isoform X2 [Malania oleifera]|uniref:U-box domain-containing protein 44-like isoform X2 n=1 Tax=Malania oleifera TaxID=397392 RepID=UPI0025ADA860|nr:U-box domain-containing protein 44-like isoform X2 [Malania oleifera]XP_057948957.1 U-box domain-containing protein 44-like isoform X2 [Malania oleifera]